MTIFAAQYLESAPKGITPAEARRHLRLAFERLPISLILLGWGLSPELEEAVAKETSFHGARLFRWQPWLTGDARTDLPQEWRTIGPTSAAIPGHNDSPDFTFICPNHSGVADFLEERLESVSATGIYQGIFLDRIRFPSPAKDPTTQLGCFCKHCIRLAADEGLDLENIRRYVLTAVTSGKVAQSLTRNLLGQPGANPSLEAFLDFRCQSITRTVAHAKRQADSLGMSLALDCFSPSLSRMVGQDLHALDKSSDWIKLMIYPSVWGPAGLPFELANLTSWLVRLGSTEEAALSIISGATGLSAQKLLSEHNVPNLDPNTMEKEISRGLELGIHTLLAGIAMVNMEGIHSAAPEQIRHDLLAARSADGLVISWDLWQTPLEYLDIIRTIWEK